MTAPLLSIVLFGRDDDYTENFADRLNFCLGYNDHVFQKTNASIEVCFVEWGTRSLSQKIDTSQHKTTSIRWFHVDTKSDSINLDQDVNICLANNTGIRKARGNFILVGQADNIFSPGAAIRLVELLQSLEKYQLTGEELFLIPRRFLSKAMSMTKNNFGHLDSYFLLQSNANFPFFAQKTNINSGMGSILMSKNNWHHIRGISEAKKGHGGDDIELLSRLSGNHIHIDMSVFGIWQFKMARSGGTRMMTADQDNWPRDYLSSRSKPNTVKWGDPKNVVETTLLKKRKAQKHPKSGEFLQHIPTKLEMLWSLLRGLYHTKFMYIFSISEYCASIFLDLLLKKNGSTFLILDEELFFRSGKIIFQNSPHLSGLICFSQTASIDGELYKKQYIGTVNELIPYNHHGHLTAYRHSERTSHTSLARASRRFLDLGSHFAYSTSDGEIVQNLSFYSKQLPSLKAIVVKKTSKARFDAQRLGFEKKYNFLSISLYLKK